MNLPSLRLIPAIVLDVALLAICLLHIPSLLDRARLPFDIAESDGHLLIRKILDSSACASVHTGDRVLALHGVEINRDHQAEFLTDFRSVNDKIAATTSQNGIVQTSPVRLVGAYDVPYVVVTLLVGFVAWCVGVWIVVSRSRERAAVVLHWAMVLMGTTVILTFGQVSLEWFPLYVARPFFFLAYGGVAASFLHLTFLFPREGGSSVWRLRLIYVPMLLLVIAMIMYHVESLRLQSLPYADIFHGLFDIFHIAVVAYVCFGIALFARSYVRSESFEEKKKLQWIFWGLAIGPMPFLLLTVIPQYYLPFGFVPEEFTLIFLVVIPIAFGISFIKYHLLNIEVVINRTTVYAMVLGVVLLLYTAIVSSFAALAGTYTVGVSAAVAVLVALLFEPVRKKIQHVVDARFFRVRYDFREALRRFSGEIMTCVDARELADVMIDRTMEILPVERIGIFLLRAEDKRLFAVSNRGFEFLERRTVRFRAEEMQTQLDLPVALDSKIEPGVSYESADTHVFTRWGIALVFPMKSAAGGFIGFFVLGPKRSGERFRIEDVDLLLNAATEAGVEFERIALQHRLIDEQTARQRLIELNQMKSDFVSNVSHELRTPLTSIRMYAELLGEERPSSQRKRRAYLNTIIGETDRLNRLVGTILDTARIEHGEKHFRMQEVDVREIVERVLSTLKYQLGKHRFKVEFRKPRHNLTVNGDPDAIAEALINLVDNAIKFSTTRKYLKITVRRKNGQMLCVVRDKGIGISSEALPRLFERFYRDPQTSKDVQGVGLGLPLVRQIMKAHGGEVVVRSTLGTGSTFTLAFPREGRSS